MPVAESVFFVCLALILYPYVLYPLLIAALARLRPRPVRRGAGSSLSVTIIVAAHNEEARIEGRSRELVAILDLRGNPGDEILIVTDGSTDGTAAVVRRHAGHCVRLVELAERGGKAAAISHAAALARNDILVFADTRQTWADDALTRLLENFADPAVGAVSGDLVLAARYGTMAGVGLYWRFEKWLRRQESAVGSQVGVTGAISACRRSLFRPIPAGTVLDDVYWPTGVALQGKRVVHDSRAVAYDRLPDKTRDEFRRKVRTLAGNFQLACLRPRLLLPWRNPVWIPFVSHKLARLVVPWALVGVGVTSLLCDGMIFDIGIAAQGVGYALAVTGLLTGRGKLTSAASSFLVLNAAAWVAFWVWLTGRAAGSWTKVAYRAAVVASPGRIAESADVHVHA